MMKNRTWEIKCLVRYIADYEPENMQDHDATVEEVARAIELNKEKDCGFIMPIQMFLDWAIDGFITDYDGIGYWLDKEGNRIDAFNFYDDRLPEGAMFVAWYNK